MKWIIIWGVSMQRKNYAKLVLDLMPRMLSSLDRNPLSESFGCFHKDYWFYKTSDFASARFQEPMLSFALLYKNKFEGNNFFRDEKILEYALAALSFWAKTQHSNGSFDEWYPNENSFIATAFSSYAAASTFFELKRFLKKEEKEKILKALKKAGNFLSKHSEPIGNQLAVSIAALELIAKVSEEKKFTANALKKLRELKKLQSREGWFKEYGGADIGYSTVLVDYLAKYYKLSRNKAVKKMLAPCFDFLKYFVHEDGSLGGVYGSRNTEFKLPYGFEIFSSNNDARFIANRIAQGINSTVNPLAMDDRFAFSYHSSFLEAFLEARPAKEKMCKFKELKVFRQAGLIVWKKGRKHFICNAKKGGVFKLFDGKKLVAADAGFTGRKGKNVFCSQWNDSSEFKLNGNTLEIEGKFKELFPVQRLSVAKNIALRSFLFSVGKSSSMSLFLKKMLKKKLISKAKNARISFKRKIVLGEKIEVFDYLFKPEKLRLDSLVLSSDFVPQYTPTAKFYSYSKETYSSDYSPIFSHELFVKREF